MASFSTYASRFLTSGGGITGGHGAEAFVASSPGASQHSLTMQSSSDGLPDPLAESSATQAGAGGAAAGAMSLAGASRYGLASYAKPSGGRHASGAQGAGGMREIEDEEERDDEEQDDGDAWRHERSHLANLGGSGRAELDTPSASRIAGFARQHDEHDEADPFLAEDAIDDAAAVAANAAAHKEPRHRERSASSRRSARGRAASQEAKARGWLAHADSSTASGSSDHSLSPPLHRVAARGSHSRGARSNKAPKALPNDIYRDPDEESSEASASHDDDEEEGSDEGESAADESHARRTQRRQYDSASESEASSSDESHHQRTRNASRRAQSSNNNNGGGGGSSLREPLLSSTAGSASLPHLPGAFRGQTSRIVAADIYAYPHPPAKSGWTPWAPGNRVGWREWRDKGALAAWAAALVLTFVLAGLTAIGAKSVSAPSSPKVKPSPYYTLTRSVPILFLLTLLSVGAAGANLVLLRQVSRLGGARVLRVGLVGVPACLTLGWAWAFASSFIYDDEGWSGGGWSTGGLRLLSLIPLAAAILFARAVWKRRAALSRTLAVLELSARIIAAHPALLILSLVQLGVFLALSVPMLSIFARLFLLGHFGAPRGEEKVWQTDTRARWLAWGTFGAWLWTWAAMRGVQRVTVAGVVSHWYFHRSKDGPGPQNPNASAYSEAGEDSLPGPAPGDWLGTAPGAQDPHLAPPTQIDIVRASFARATGPALGTVCAAALVLSLARLGMAIATAARRTSRAMSARGTPAFLQPLAHVAALLAGLSAVLQGLSDFALVYVGVTGEGFAAAARRSARLVRGHGVKGVMEGLIIHLLLDLSTLSLSFLAGVAGFLFSAHNLHVPADAPLVGLLCALVPYWTLRLCADVLSNAADTLFLCYSIDDAAGEEHCKEAADAFTNADETLPF